MIGDIPAHIWSSFDDAKSAELRVNGTSWRGIIGDLVSSDLITGGTGEVDSLRKEYGFFWNKNKISIKIKTTLKQ